MRQSGRPKGADSVQPMAVGNRSRLGPHCCGIVIYNEYRNFNVSPAELDSNRGGASAAYGASSYGARRTWRQAAGRSAILSPGLGFAGGDGLGWSTASVNQ